MELTVAESKNTFNAKQTLEVGGKSYDITPSMPSKAWRNCPTP